jgi:hypothetical protein
VAGCGDGTETWNFLEILIKSEPLRQDT